MLKNQEKMMRDYYKLSKEDVLSTLAVDAKGLDDNPVFVMREAHGTNELQELAPASTLVVFISRFKDFLVWILFVGAVIILNAILGTVQHVKAEQSLRSLNIAFVTMISFHIGLSYSEPVAITMAFATLCLSRLVHGFNCRMKEPLTISTLFSFSISLETSIITL